MRNSDKKTDNSQKEKDMHEFSPALGLIFGVPAGALFGIILNRNIALFAGAGAGIGLVAGAAVYSFFSKKKGSG